MVKRILIIFCLWTITLGLFIMAISTPKQIPTPIQPLLKQLM
jgi:hypothetical protein